MHGPRRFPGAYFLQNLVRQRHLLYQLVRRDFRQRYIGSIAGWLWGLIHPLVLLAVYTFVFSFAFRMRLPAGEVTDSYPLFLFAGMLPWLLFSETLQRSSASLLEHANLIKKSVFPSEVVPLTILLSTLISHLLALSLLLAAAGIWAGGLGPAVFVLPVYFVLVGMLTLGIAWIAASLHVYLRDTAQVVAVMLTAWFWLTPIFMYEEQFKQFGGTFAWLLQVNPLAYVVRGYREAILGGRLPAASDFAALAGFAAASVVLGGLFFRHAKRGFADVL